MIRLVKPTIKYKTTFLEAQKEFEPEGRADNKLKELNGDFSAYVKILRNQEKGKELPAGYVSATVYWLIDGNKFIGKASVRHKLTKVLRLWGGHIGYEIRPSERKKGYGSKILALSLKKAKKLGIKKVFVTCNEDNLGSKKIIEKNGGVFIGKVKVKVGKDAKKIKLRYWINNENS